MNRNIFKVIMLLAIITVFDSFNLKAQTAFTLPKITMCADTHDTDISISFDRNILPLYMFEGVSTSQPLQYSVFFGNTQSVTEHCVAQIRGTNCSTTFYRFQNITNGSFLSSSNYTINIPIPKPIYPDHYADTKIIVRNSYSTCTIEFSIDIDVLYPIIMDQRWCDVIALVDCHENGGYCLAGYQWYHNGQIMNGKTSSSLYAGAGNSFVIGDEYSVLITRLDGSKMMSCPIEIKQSINNECK